MPRDVRKLADDYMFTAFLHLSPEKGVRHTKSGTGSHANERMCKVTIRVPKSAYSTPEFEIDISFGGENGQASPEAIQAQVEDALSQLPVTVKVEPITRNIRDRPASE